MLTDVRGMVGRSKRTLVEDLMTELFPDCEEDAIQSPLPGPSNWIAVASAEHVQIGRTGGFMQVCHGKGGPLRRIRAGDRVVYYSPTATFGGKDRVQAFTALGCVISQTPYQVEMNGGFKPFRHDVVWDDSDTVGMAELLPRLVFHEGQRNWGAKLRFGLLKICVQDMRVIAAAMSSQQVKAED